MLRACRRTMPGRKRCGGSARKACGGSAPTASNSTTCTRRTRTCPVAESAGAIRDLIAAGKVRAAGASNVGVAELEQFAAACPLAAYQPPYNMLQRQIEADTLPWCRQHGVSVLAYWPLAKGLLAGKMSRDETFAPTDSRRKYPMFQGDEWQKNHDLLDKLREIAAASGHSVAQTVINWTIHQPGITAALCGAKRPRSDHRKRRGGRLGVDRGPADPHRSSSRRARHAGRKISGVRTRWGLESGEWEPCLTHRWTSAAAGTAIGLARAFCSPIPDPYTLPRPIVPRFSAAASPEWPLSHLPLVACGVWLRDCILRDQGIEAMPRIGATLGVLATIAFCIGFNIFRYPKVWEVVADMPGQCGSAQTPRDACRLRRPPSIRRRQSRRSPYQRLFPPAERTLPQNLPGWKSRRSKSPKPRKNMRRSPCHPTRKRQPRRSRGARSPDGDKAKAGDETAENHRHRLMPRPATRSPPGNHAGRRRQAGVDSGPGRRPTTTRKSRQTFGSRHAKQFGGELADASQRGIEAGRPWAVPARPAERI